MKESKRVVMGLLVLVLLLLGWGLFTTIRATRLEKRLKQVEASYQRLQARHRAFASTVANTMLRPGASPGAVIEAKVEIIRESLGMQDGTYFELRPTLNEVNSMPQRVTSK